MGCGENSIRESARVQRGHLRCGAIGAMKLEVADREKGASGKAVSVRSKFDFEGQHSLQYQGCIRPLEKTLLAYARVGDSRFPRNGLFSFLIFDPSIHRG